MQTEKMTTRVSALLNVIVDMKVGDQADIKNLIECLECNCIEASGEDAEIIDIKIADRKLLIEGEDESY
ncbi:MAG: hypothetical protein AB1552_13965 [Nitrospirota bacterium]